MAANTQEELVPLLKRMVDGMERLVGDHLTLARLELGEDVRALGKRIVELVTFVPFGLVGLGLLGAAGAYFLAPLIGLAFGFLLVGGVFTAAGVIGTWMAVKRPSKSEPVLNDSGAQIKKSADVIGAAGDPVQLADNEERRAAEETRNDLH
jgi:Putative Actinobacterial Holin-X, holin superfamily III